MGMKPPTMLDPHPPEPREPAPAATGRPGAYPQLDLDRKSTSKNYWWVWAIVFAAIAFGCYELYQFENGKKAAMASKKGTLRPRNIPVVAAAAHAGDMPGYLQGLGTVTAFKTVTVKSRVHGQLVSLT